MSLGQGQEIVAENAMAVAAKTGHWVILQNIHLVKTWLPALEKVIEEYSEDSHQVGRIVDFIPENETNVVCDLLSSELPAILERRTGSNT